MKVMNIFSLGLLSVASCIAMNQSTPPSPRILSEQECKLLALPLTEAEDACSNWAFQDQENMKTFGQSYSCFKPEERDDFTALNYAQNPDKLETLGKKVIAQFYQNMETAHKEIKYPAPLLLQTFLHLKYQNQNKTITNPKNEREVGQWAFQQKLDDAERASFHEKGFDSTLSYATAEKMGNLIAKKMAKLGLISNTQEAKAQKAQEYFEKKKAAFAAWYKNSPQPQNKPS